MMRTRLFVCYTALSLAGLLTGCGPDPSKTPFEGVWRHVQHVADEAGRRETVLRVMTDGPRFRIQSLPFDGETADQSAGSLWVYDGQSLYISSPDAAQPDGTGQTVEKIASPSEARLRALRFWRTDVDAADRIGAADPVAGRPTVQYVYVEPRPDSVLRVETLLDAETRVALKRETLILDPVDNHIVSRGAYSAESIAYQSPPDDAFMALQANRQPAS